MDRRGALASAFVLTGGLFFALAQMRDAVPEAPLGDAHTVDAIAKIILGVTASVAPSSTRQNISIHYDLSQWSLTRGGLRSTYFSNVIRLVPVIFERIPESSRVELVANNIFDTIQGREVRQPALSLMFTRHTAAKIIWSHVTKGEIARLADRAWASPTIGWE